MSLFHNLKRTAFKGKKTTQDPIFDKLCNQFKDIEKQAVSMQTAMKDSFKAWASVKKNVLMAIDSANKAVGADEKGQDLIISAKRATDTISGEEVQQEGALRTAMETLNEYIASLRETSAKRDRRNEIAKDVDYYSGKVEELASKGDKTPQDKMNSAQAKLDEKDQAYEAAHEEAMAALQKSLELKDEIFPRVVVAYLQAQNRMLTRAPYDDIIREHGRLLDVWPSVTDYEVKNPINIQRVSSARKPTPSLTGVPPVAPPRPRMAGGLPTVKVMYDFDAETDAELDLKAGQIVTVLEEIDENWLRGRTSDGKEGIFPKSYCQ